MRCHFTTVDGVRVFIPYCYSSLHQEDASCCTCRDPAEVHLASTEAKQQLREAEQQIYRLERLVYKLTRHLSFKPKK